MARKIPAYRRAAASESDSTTPPVAAVNPTTHPWSVSFRPRNAAQAEASELFHRVDILTLLGPSGSGKTVVALALAAGEVYRHAVERITLIRPCVEAAEHTLGWLGGGLDEKLDPHYLAFSEALASVAKGMPAKRLRRLALSFARGLTFSNEIAVLDEAQNCTFAELKLILTRLGTGSKLVIVGDPEQTDIRNSGLLKFAGRMDGASGFAAVRFSDDDVIRHPRQKEWLRRLR